MPHAQFPDLLCPWPGCKFQIWFVDFQLELADRSLYDRGIVAWETGAGLIGCCPGCRQSVLFKVAGKSRVEGTTAPASSVALPNDWFERAVLLDSEGNVIDC
jgi:hypothetical protein